MRDFLKNMGVLAIAGLITVGALEGLSRLAYPVQYGHKSFDLNGAPVYPATDMTGVVPGLTYHQRTQEFDILTTHTERGFRGPAGGFMDVDNPAYVFIGDSMTYGIGLRDEQTIPYLYCQALSLTCANLGRPGIGTGEAIAILERRLKEGWRPGMVILIMNVMSSAQFGGNDLTDNLNAAQASANHATAIADKPGNLEEQAHGFTVPRLTRGAIMEHSNLARLAYYVMAPMLRTAFSPGFATVQLQDAMAITRSYLTDFDDLSEEYGFAQRIFIVHPMQDLSRGTWKETEQAMASLSSLPVVSTAPALMDIKDPLAYYYPLDGHVRPDGAAKIAAFMVKEN